MPFWYLIQDATHQDGTLIKNGIKYLCHVGNPMPCGQLPFGDGDIGWWYDGFVSWVYHIVYVIYRDTLADIHDIPSGKRENITMERSTTFNG